MQGDNEEKKGRMTHKQLDVLKLLFRFRFATSDHIAAAQNIQRNAAVVRLRNLTAKEFVRRKRDGKDRVEGRPAVFSLAPKGIALLKEESKKYSPKVLNAIRTNTSASSGFIERSLSIFTVFNHLRKDYPDLLLLTKSNLAADKFDYLPEHKPDALLFFEKSKKYFFMYVFDADTPDFANIRRLKPIADYEKSGRWEDATKSNFPHVLIICSIKRQETIMRKRLYRMMNDNQIEIDFATTTLDRLLITEKAWRLVGEDSDTKLEEI